MAKYFNSKQKTNLRGEVDLSTRVKNALNSRVLEESKCMVEKPRKQKV